MGGEAEETSPPSSALGAETVPVSPPELVDRVPQPPHNELLLVLLGRDGVRVLEPATQGRHAHNAGLLVAGSFTPRFGITFIRNGYCIQCQTDTIFIINISHDTCYKFDC